MKNLTHPQIVELVGSFVGPDFAKTNQSGVAPRTTGHLNILNSAEHRREEEEYGEEDDGRSTGMK